MWASCIKKLSPFPYELTTEVPKFIKKAFNDAGIFNEKEILVPVHPVALLGVCSTHQYPDCPNIPEHHIENSQDYNDPIDYLCGIGKYYWFDFDINLANEDALQLRMVFNEGDADCNDGLWGAVWERNTGELIANILTTGDSEATVEVVLEGLADKYQKNNFWVPTSFDRYNGYDPLPCESVKYANDLNLEKIIGLAIRICCIYRSEWTYQRQG